MGMGDAETSVVAEPLTQIRAIVDGVTSSSDDPAHLTSFFCDVVKMALEALAEARESGDAVEMAPHGDARQEMDGGTGARTHTHGRCAVGMEYSGTESGW